MPRDACKTDTPIQIIILVCCLITIIATFIYFKLNGPPECMRGLISSLTQSAVKPFKQQKMAEAAPASEA